MMFPPLHPLADDLSRRAAIQLRAPRHRIALIEDWALGVRDHPPPRAMARQQQQRRRRGGGEEEGAPTDDGAERAHDGGALGEAATSSASAAALLRAQRAVAARGPRRVFAARQLGEACREMTWHIRIWWPLNHDEVTLPSWRAARARARC